VVRQADGGEKLTLLDGQTVTLDADTLVIADGEGALAMAGIMGGEGSAVHGRTRDIFLESAHFSPQAIAGQARRYGLRTESSHRFERGVDADLQVLAIERASALLLEIAGGEPGPVLEVVSEDGLPVRGEILLREARIERILGANPGVGEVERTLTALGCGCVREAEGWRVTPPSYRFDLSIEADLIEEIGRVYGYDRIPNTTQQFRPVIQQRNESEVSMPEIRKSLVDRGYQEVITYSFVDEETERLLNPEHSPMALANPLSADLAVMRGSLWSGMLRAVRHNLNRQQGRLKFFETGLRFVNASDGLQQIPSIAGAVTGAVLREQWGVAPREADFFDVKSDVEALLALSGHDVDAVFAPIEDPALHPGQSAGITVNGTEAGRIGALHPTLQARLGLDQRVYLFELPLEMLRRGRIPSFAPLSKFPAIRRDIAVVVDQPVPAARVLDVIAGRDIPQLRDVILFDVYAGVGIPEGRKSLALGLILQDLSRTLNDRKVESIVSGIVAGLARELGASLRE
jgi:phenylalanyl-tRNA synthetase beta chain